MSNKIIKETMANLVEIVRLFTSTTDGHYHEFKIDEDGWGRTSKQDGHYHYISEGKAWEENGHTHSLETNDLSENE